MKTNRVDTPKFKLIDSETFDQLDCQQEWLVKDILVKGEPAVIGGPMKTLKTSLMVDLAISLGTGKSFLNRFPAVPRRQVAVLSGESGKVTLRNLARRVSRSKGCKLDKDCLVDWEFKLPRFSSAEDRRWLRSALRKSEVEVVFIDPLYLCLCAGSRSISASNLYEVGPALAKVSQACLDAGATPVLVHHATKGASKTPKSGGRPLDLDDLAFAGIGEFARQWILVNRKVPYRPGSGQHSLLMSVGGSAGHSSCWDVQVDEGGHAEATASRRWKVDVKPAVFENFQPNVIG